MTDLHLNLCKKKLSLTHCYNIDYFVIGFETDNLITALEKSERNWYVAFQQPTETNKTLQNHKQKVHCSCEIETWDLFDVEECSLWKSEAYRFKLDDKSEKKKLME